MRGSKVPDEVEAEFREHYLATGNASAAARAVNLPVSTGIDLAKRANDDEAFAKARDDMYARALPDGERMLFAGMQIALERLNKDPEEVLAKLAMLGGEGGKVSYQDPGAQYLRSLAAAVDVIAKIRKLDAEKNGSISQPSTVHIIVSPTGSEPAKEAAAADPEAENGD